MDFCRNVINECGQIHATLRYGNWAWPGHVNDLNFGGHQPYLWNGCSYSEGIVEVAGTQHLAIFMSAIPGI